MYLALLIFRCIFCFTFFIVWNVCYVELYFVAFIVICNSFVKETKFVSPHVMIYKILQKNIIHTFIVNNLLGPDYMANFSPGRNFSSANRAEISSRLLKQIFLKSNCQLHGEGFSPGRNSARARIFSPAKRAWKAEKISCNRNGISARAEKWAWTCAVILFSRKRDGCR